MMRDVGLIGRLPRILCAHAENANPLYRSYLQNFDRFEPVQAKPTLASAIQIGHPVSVRKAIRILRQFDGGVEQASESELAEAASEADLTGLYNCPHTGVTLAALKKWVLAGKVGKSERVVVISTAHGLKFSAFKNRYHAHQLEGTESRFANPPIEVSARYEQVREVLFRALESRNAHIAARI